MYYCRIYSVRGRKSSLRCSSDLIAVFVSAPCRNPSGPPKQQALEYFVIFDVQATCLQGQAIKPQEIIELTCCLLNSSTLEIEETFHTYVGPVYRPRLTPFCIKLTGITQEVVDAAPTFSRVEKTWTQPKVFSCHLFLTLGCYCFFRLSSISEPGWSPRC